MFQWVLSTLCCPVSVTCIFQCLLSMPILCFCWCYLYCVFQWVFSASVAYTVFFRECCLCCLPVHANTLFFSRSCQYLVLQYLLPIVCFSVDGVYTVFWHLLCFSVAVFLYLLSMLCFSVAVVYPIFSNICCLCSVFQYLLSMLCFAVDVVYNYRIFSVSVCFSECCL